MTTTSRSERARRALALALGLSVAGLVTGCSSCGDKTGASADAAVSDLSPVPEPEGLAAELVVAKPSDAWAKLRDLGGTPARLLPQSFGMLVSTLLGLPPAAAEAVDADLPLVGAATDEGKDELAAVVAVHVRNGKELVARLSAGADANYAAREDAQSSITLLEPKPGKASSEVALGVLGNYLIAAAHPSDLTKVGPYVARTLAKREAPHEPIVLTLKKKALAGPLAAHVRELWKGKKAELELLDKANREKHGGRAPDFGDPGAALAGLGATVEGFARVLESAAAGRIVVDPLPDRLDVDVALDAEKTGAAAEMMAGLSVGDGAPLGNLPADAALSILTRTTPASREASAKSIGEGVAELFGDRLNKDERDKLEHSLADLAHGRGDWETYALVLSAGRGGLGYRAALTDAKAFDSGAKGLVHALGTKAFSEPLRQFVGEFGIKQSSAQIPGISGNVQRTLINVKGAGMAAATKGAATAEPKPVEILWWTKDDKAYGALSFDAVPVLTGLVAGESEPKATHASDARVKAAILRVKDASFVVLAEPLRLDPRQGGAVTPNAPVIVSFGRTGHALSLRVDADKVALEGLLRAAMVGRN